MDTTDPARLVAIGIDAADPQRMAEFWADALGWDIERRSGGLLDLVPDGGAPFRIEFEPSDAVKVAQNRIHFDLTTASLDDQADTVSRLLGRGGRHVDIGQSPDEAHVVLGDPEGNELCVIDPANRFLAGCGRLGAVNCDGKRTTGSFWSAVLGWPLVWDQDEETAIQAPDRTGPKITWSGPPLMPKPTRNRLRLHIAPPPGRTVAEETTRLLGLGAAPVGESADGEAWVELVDPDGNEFRVVAPG